MRLLLAEDDDRIAANVIAALELAGFVVEHERGGEEAWVRGDDPSLDGVILDLGLPTLDGLTILKRWRKAGLSFPVLILTARGNWEERVEGIDAGADDYLTKPFRMEELVARVRALIRRSSGHPAPVIVAGPVELDTRQMRISVSGQPVPLTPQEYRLVSYLMHNCGRVVDRAELVEHLYLQDFERDSNSVEVLIGRVRRKLGPDVIETRRGFGYVIERPAA